MNRSVRVALIVLAAIQAALFVYYLRANIILEPYWDMYSHVTRYLQFRADGDWLRYLWDPHVQHRHLWMRLLTWLDAGLFSGISYPFIAAATACQLVTAALVWREAARVAPAGLRTAAGCLAVMLVLTSVAAVDAALPINTVYPQVVMFSVLAIVLFADGPAWRRVAAVAAAVAAAFANTLALVLWPILVWMAWREGKGARWIAALSAVGVAFIVRFVIGLPLADQAAAAPAALVTRLDYLASYMGLPWTRAAALAIPGRLLGIALFVTGGAIVARVTLRDRPDRHHRVAGAFIALSLASAVLAAAGREPNPGEVLVPVRYSVLLAPLHVGLVMIAAMHAADRAVLAMKAAVAAALLLVVQQVGAGQAAIENTTRVRDTVRRFAAGQTEAGMERVVFDDLPEARRQLDAIQDAQLYTNVR
ncbi:MAG: hypothetical protein AB7K63_10145 [Vicinamibacterales bacterium]